MMTWRFDRINQSLPLVMLFRAAINSTYSCSSSPSSARDHDSLMMSLVQPPARPSATALVVGSGDLARKCGPCQLSYPFLPRLRQRAVTDKGSRRRRSAFLLGWFFVHTGEDLLIAVTQDSNHRSIRLLERRGAVLTITFEQPGRSSATLRVSARHDLGDRRCCGVAPLPGGRFLDGRGGCRRSDGLGLPGRAPHKQPGRLLRASDPGDSSGRCQGSGTRLVGAGDRRLRERLTPSRRTR